MATLIKKTLEVYSVLFEEFPDPRTKEWLFVAKPYQIFIIVFTYLMFVLKWGPKWMRKRQAYNLDKILIVYNAAQVIVCTFLFIEALRTAWGWNYKWICEPVDFSYTPKALYIARLTYCYYLLKIIDLLDTVFFVLRKKNDQVSFLHLYHHTGMVGLIWGGVTYLPGGHGTLVGVINSFVHVVMYSYYLLTVIKPSYKQSFWWKKHITQLQIIQFFWCVVHMGFIVFKPDCAYPRWTSAIFLPQNLFMLVLFVDFYVKTYMRKPIVRTDKNNCNNCKEDNMFKNNGISCVGRSNNIENNFTSNGAVKSNFADINNHYGIINRFQKDNSH